MLLTPPPLFNKKDYQIIDELRDSPTISQRIREMMSLADKQIQMIKDRRYLLSGVPPDSVIYRVNWDYIACARELRRVVLCAEERIDLSLCDRYVSAYSKCRHSTIIMWSKTIKDL